MTSILFPGARGWATPSLLKNLKLIGGPAEMTDAYNMQVGAKCRVFQWENSHNGGLHIRRRFASLERCQFTSVFLDRLTVWRDWYRNHFIGNVYRAHGLLQDVARQHQVSIATLLQGRSEDPIPKVRWQKRCCEVLRIPSRAVVLQHLRARLDRWQLLTLPGHRVARTEQVLRLLGALVPLMRLGGLPQNAHGRMDHSPPTGQTLALLVWLPPRARLHHSLRHVPSGVAAVTCKTTGCTGTSRTAT